MTTPDFDLDLGDNHTLSWATDWQQPGVIIGAIIDHLKPDGGPCGGGVQWADSAYQREHPESTMNRARWTLEGQADAHITLSPSVLCLTCGDHGFIRDGKWVRA